MFGVSYKTAYHRFNLWSKHRLFEHAFYELAAEYRRNHSNLPLLVDTSHVKNVLGKDVLGPNHADRGRNSTKVSLLCDSLAHPLTLTFHKGNRNDSLTLPHLLAETVRRYGNVDSHNCLYADKGYDSKTCRLACEMHGLEARIPHRHLLPCPAPCFIKSKRFLTAPIRRAVIFSYCPTSPFVYCFKERTSPVEVTQKMATTSKLDNTTLDFKIGTDSSVILDASTSGLCTLSCVTGNVKLGGIAAPTENTEVLPKYYFDQKIITDPVTLLSPPYTALVAATGNVDISTAQTLIQGVIVPVDGIVLLTAQTTPLENGLYVANSFNILERSSVMTVGSDAFNVTVRAPYIWYRCTNAFGQAVVGTDVLEFVQDESVIYGGSLLGNSAAYGTLFVNQDITFGSLDNVTLSDRLDLKVDKSVADDTALAWSSGLAAGTHHRLRSGTDALAIEKTTGAPIASFLENGATAIYGTLFLSQDITFSALGNASLTSRLDAKAPLASPTFTGTVGGLTKAMVGLASVDNTSDASKPISTLTQAALNAKVNQSAADNTAFAWSSGLVSDGNHYLTTGADGLVILSNSGTASAKFHGDGAGAGFDGKALFFQDVQILGAVSLQGIPNLADAVNGKPNSVDVYTKSATDTLLNAKQNEILFWQALPGGVALTNNGGDAVVNVKGIKVFSPLVLTDGSTSITLSVESNFTVNALTVDTNATITQNLTCASLTAENVNATNNVSSNSITAYNADGVTVDDNLIVTGDLQVDGALNSAGIVPYWCAGRFLTDGTVPAASRKGIHRDTFSVTRTSLGNYTVTMPAHPDGTNYVLLVSGKTYHLPVFQDSSTAFRITPKSVSNNTEDADVDFAVLA